MLAFDPALPVVVIAQFGHVATFAMAHIGAMYFLAQAVPPARRRRRKVSTP